MINKLFNFDWYLLTPVFILITVSLITLFSINPLFLKSQIIFLIISFTVFLLISNLNVEIFRHYSPVIYIVSVVLLILIFIIGIESRGSLRWIEIFGFRIQFSEILKPFLAIALANFVTTRKSLSITTLATIFTFLAPIALLIFLQPDLGDALIYSIVVLLLTIYLGFSFKYFAAFFIPLFLIIPFFWNILHDYQKQRVLTFLDPSRDPLGTSYNVIQSIIAVGSGMILGRGLGLGTQSGLRFLPERHTDFIFATLSEQLGFVGSSLVIICFGLFLYRMFRSGQQLENMFSRVLFTIVFLTFLVQLFVNIGMNMLLSKQVLLYISNKQDIYVYSA